MAAKTSDSSRNEIRISPAGSQDPQDADVFGALADRGEHRVHNAEHSTDRHDDRHDDNRDQKLLCPFLPASRNTRFRWGLLAAFLYSLSLGGQALAAAGPSVRIKYEKDIRLAEIFADARALGPDFESNVDPVESRMPVTFQVRAPSGNVSPT